MAVSEIDRDRMREACEVARKSNDSKCKVGIVLHHKSRNQTLYGCNEISTAFGRHEVLHAEHNLFWGSQNSEETPDWEYYQFKDSEQAVVHITKAPCLRCSKAISEANIKRVVCPPPYEINPNTGKPSKWFSTQCKGLAYLKANGVTVDHVEIEMRDGVPYLMENV